MSVLDDKSIDVFFIALHGKFGEDGQLQQILEDKSLVYTGSGPAASRIAFDKIASKRAFESAGVKTAPMIEVTAKIPILQILPGKSRTRQKICCKTGAAGQQRRCEHSR